ATLATDMEDREIGMDPREGTRCSPPSQSDRFPAEAQSESPLPLVLASPPPVKARGDAVPPTSPVPLVPKETWYTGPPVPIVPPPETREQGMRVAVQCWTRMVSIHERSFHLSLQSSSPIGRCRYFPHTGFRSDCRGLSQRICDTLRDREKNKMICTMGSYREQHGDLGPHSIDIHLSQREVSHHRCRDCGLIIIVSQEKSSSPIGRCRYFPHTGFRSDCRGLSQRICDTLRDREKNKMICTMGSYREQHGDLGPHSIDIHLSQREVSHHRCRDCGLIIIVSQEKVRAHASLRVIEKIISYR
ncbi:hypothetical protein MTR67_043268, partial [Solanum verrucosum]